MDNDLLVKFMTARANYDHRIAELVEGKQICTKRIIEVLPDTQPYHVLIETEQGHDLYMVQKVEFPNKPTELFVKQLGNIVKVQTETVNGVPVRR